MVLGTPTVVLVKEAPHFYYECSNYHYYSVAMRGRRDLRKKDYVDYALKLGYERRLALTALDR